MEERVTFENDPLANQLTIFEIASKKVFIVFPYIRYSYQIQENKSNKKTRFLVLFLLKQGLSKLGVCPSRYFIKTSLK